jgi:aryl-alcohol dehydrogenase-like predicted oxidoreductase
MSADTSFAGDDWRSGSPVFRGSSFRQNLEVVDRLKQFAADSLHCTVAQLAVAWTLANPAVDVAIVGARHPAHIQESLAAAELGLSEADLEQINRIMVGSAAVGGPSPEAMPSAE